MVKVDKKVDIIRWAADIIEANGVVEVIWVKIGELV